jgi:hypothetical protein
MFLDLKPRKYELRTSSFVQSAREAGGFRAHFLSTPTTAWTTTSSYFPDIHSELSCCAPNVSIDPNVLSKLIFRLQGRQVSSSLFDVRTDKSEIVPTESHIRCFNTEQAVIV